jgi:hypothetical protein
MLANLFARPNVAEWSAAARRAAEEKRARTTVKRRVLYVRPGRGLDPENLLLIGSKGRVIVEPKPRAPRPPKPEPQPKPIVYSDRWRADRLHARAEADRPYQPRDIGAIAAGRI